MEFEIKNGQWYIKKYTYNEGKLLLEGEYLNGGRNGKRKDYYSSFYEFYLLYEGEYLNGERIGKGKEYNKNGSLEYAGE